MITFLATSFWLQKRGNALSEYEDAFALNQKPGRLKDAFRVAVADGATESSFAREWAKMLVRSFRDRAFLDVQDLQTRTESLSEKWHDIVGRQPLPWFAQEKAQMGAFSTFLGLELFLPFDEANAWGEWHAIAIGDTCLFQIRDDAPCLNFPIQSSGDFGNTPVMISSNFVRNQALWDKVLFRTGDWRAGDIFILTTDALAAWFTRCWESGYKPWNEILTLLSIENRQGAFVDWVNEQRASSMRNDDVTCIIVTAQGI